jgi:hypothetical protein
MHGDQALALELRLDRLRLRAAERIEDRDVALELVERLDVLLGLIAGVLDVELDLPAVDAPGRVERLEERLVAGDRGLAERRCRAAERPEFADPDGLGRRVDAGPGLDRAAGGGVVECVAGVAGTACAEREARSRHGGHGQE